MEATDYCSYELSKLLKESGFDESCGYSYYIHAWMTEPKLTSWAQAEREAEMYDGTDICQAPTLWQAQKWLRDKKDVVITIQFEPIDDSSMIFTYSIHQYDPDGGKNIWDCWKTTDSLNICGSCYSGGWDSYEQALSAGIKNALKQM